MKFVLQPLTIEQLRGIFNDNSIKILNYFIKKSIFSQPERRIWQKKLPIQIPKEHIEQWLVQSLWFQWIWAGSYPIDILNEKWKWWADVKMLSADVDNNWNLTNKDSWETSLAQKFKETGINLDNLFLNRDFETIKVQWLTIYKNKLELVMQEKDLKNIYYFILLRWWNSLYLLWMEVFIENLDLAEVDLQRTDKKDVQSVFVKNFIDEKYWYVKIYKAKKRLELRLKPKNWNDDNLCLIFSLTLDDEEVNLLDEIQKENFNIDVYWKEKFEKIFQKNP